MHQPLIRTPSIILSILLASALARNRDSPLLNRMQNRHRARLGVARLMTLPGHDSTRNLIHPIRRRSIPSIQTTTTLSHATAPGGAARIPWPARRFRPPSELVRNRADDLPRRNEFLAGLIRTKGVGVFGIDPRFIKKIGYGGRGGPMT